MDIQSMIYIVKEHMWKILVTALLASVVAAIVSFFFLSPVYRVESKLLINKQMTEGVIEYNDVLATQKLTNTYGEIIRSQRIAKLVSAELNGYVSPKAVINSIAVAPLKDSQVLKVSVTGNDPQLVKLILHKTIEVFKSEIGAIMRVENVEVLDDVPLDQNIRPIKPKPLFNVVVAGVATTIVAVGFAVFLDFVDPVLRSIHAARRSFQGWVFGPIPATALIKEEYSKKMRKKMAQPDRHDRYMDMLRKIRAQLVMQEGPSAIYMIASPHRGVATQRIALDVGRVFAEAGDRTLCIIFNGSNIPHMFNRPSERLCDNENVRGIERELAERYDWEGSIDEIRPFFRCTVHKNLYFLGLSPLLIERELLFNERFIKNMLFQLRHQFQTIIIAPSICMPEVGDALLFQPYVNAFMLIMEKLCTTKGAIKEALDQVQFAQHVRKYGLYFDIHTQKQTKPRQSLGQRFSKWPFHLRWRLRR